MKKNMIIGMTMALGMVTVGALSASAADSCGQCAEKQTVQQFTQETAALTTALQAREIELGVQKSYESIDSNRVGGLEQEIKALKTTIDAAATKFGIHACSRS